MTYPELKTKYRLSLNPQQEEAVLQAEGPVLLLAVPGSGKTTVLVTRLGYLLLCRSVPPERILTVTYTVSAAADMKARFAALFGQDLAKRLRFSTINSLCARIIDHYSKLLRRDAFRVAESESLLNAVVRGLLAESGSEYPGEQLVREARTHICYCKNALLSREEIAAHAVDGMDFPTVYRGYQAYLTQNRRMDYDDQLIYALRILRHHPDILAHFRQRCTYLCVDEAQDSSKIQHTLFRLLAAPRNNLFLVGDEDQSIYGFRAACPKALLDFEQTYPGAKVLLMETNYRSTGALVAQSAALIRRNQDRRPKAMRTENPPGQAMKGPLLSDFSRQYRYLLELAKNTTCSTAILYRNSDSALPLIDLLERQGVPYACRQRESFFFTSPVVRDLTDILKFAYHDDDREAFLRFYYKLDFKVKKPVLEGLLRSQRPGDSVWETLTEGEALEGWQLGRARALQTHFSKLPSLSAYAALQRILRFMGYGDYLREQGLDSAKADILLALAKESGQPEEFLAHLLELQQLLQTGSQPGDCNLTLSTIHGSKGLEYDRVVVMDVLDGIFPAKAPGQGPRHSEEETRETLEEERRLLYVAVTRARQQVELLRYEKKFGQEEGTASTFLDELLGLRPQEARAAGVPGAAVSRRSPSPSLPSAAQVAIWEKDYLPGTELRHTRFGKGTLLSRVGRIATIEFRESGVKKLDLALCLQKNSVSLDFPTNI